MRAITPLVWRGYNENITTTHAISAMKAQPTGQAGLDQVARHSEAWEVEQPMLGAYSG